jgi:hypothetical protein
MPDLATITDALIGQSLVYEPGTQLIYSNAGFALLGRMIERVTGDDLLGRGTWSDPGPPRAADVVARPDEARRSTGSRRRRRAGPTGRHEGYNSDYFRVSRCRGRPARARRATSPGSPGRF